MGQARRYGQMAPNMKANGSLTKQMERVSSGMQTATSMRANGFGIYIHVNGARYEG
jgi:hypothetical protein